MILAAGAWTDEMIRRFEIPMERPLLRRTKGVHIVLPRERLPLARAITLISPVDGRVMFAIPWRERTVLGTTDTDFAGTADEVAADADDVKYLCERGNGYFPGANLHADDVIATWAGLRPLIAAPPNVDESEISREHEVFTQARRPRDHRRRQADDLSPDGARGRQQDARAADASSARPSTAKRDTRRTGRCPARPASSRATLEGVAAIGRR